MKYLSKILIIFSIFVGSFLAPLNIGLQKTTQENMTLAGTQIVQNTYELTVTPLEAHAELKGPDHGEPSSYFGCSWYEIHCWLMDLIYMIAVPVGNFFVGLAGMVLDFFMLHSISSTSYRSGFIEAGWEILRDVTNIFFLFALILLAFRMVFGQGGAKKSLLNIIVIALTINFSLFMGYLILDISNIFSHVFYNKITASEAETRAVEGVDSFMEIESRSLAIADKIDPQKLTDIAQEDSSRTLKLLVVLLAGFINFTLIKVFIKVALLMLGRTVGLFITLVLSPLAFTSVIIPKMRGIPYVGFDNWLKDLIKLCFMAPVFLFFLYLTVQFINIGLPGAESGESIFMKMLNILIPMIAIVALITISKDVSEKMAGEIGGRVAKSVSKVVSTVGKASLGGVAIAASAGLAATSVAARGASFIAGGEKTAVGRSLSKTGNVLASTKLDLTKIPGFEKAAGSKVTGFTQKITSKSSRGRKEAVRKWTRTPFSGLKSNAVEDEKARLDRIKAREEKDTNIEKNGGRFGSALAAAQRGSQKEEEKWRQENDKDIKKKLDDKKDMQDERSEREKEAAADKAALDKEQAPFKEKLQELEEERNNLRAADGFQPTDQGFIDVVNAIKGLKKTLKNPDPTNDDEKDLAAAQGKYDTSKDRVSELSTEIAKLNKQIKEKKDNIKADVTRDRQSEAVVDRGQAAGVTVGATIGTIILPGAGSVLGGAIGRQAGKYFGDKIAK